MKSIYGDSTNHHPVSCFTEIKPWIVGAGMCLLTQGQYLLMSPWNWCTIFETHNPCVIRKKTCVKHRSILSDVVPAKITTLNAVSLTLARQCPTVMCIYYSLHLYGHCKHSCRQLATRHILIVHDLWWVPHSWTGTVLLEQDLLQLWSVRCNTMQAGLPSTTRCSWFHQRKVEFNFLHWSFNCLYTECVPGEHMFQVSEFVMSPFSGSERILVCVETKAWESQNQNHHWMKSTTCKMFDDINWHDMSNDPVQNKSNTHPSFCQWTRHVCLLSLFDGFRFAALSCLNSL